MAGPNIEKMSLKELTDLENRVRKQIVIAKDREKSRVKQEILATLEDTGFSVSELFGSGRGSLKGSKVAVKYRDKSDPSNTWTGRGRQPKWLAARIAKGAKIQDFAV
jgi:DNA-binding protein H-NS